MGNSCCDTIPATRHDSEGDITRMKSIARSYLWWPGLDGDLEKQARSCLPCQAVKQPPPPAPLHPWIWPDRPWQRIHIDFAGPFLGRMFCLWLTHTLYGLKSSKLTRQPVPRLYRHYVSCSHHMDCQNKSYLTMVHTSSLLNFTIFS